MKMPQRRSGGESLRPLRPRSRRIPSLAALMTILTVLLVFNLLNWRLLAILKQSKEHDLVERLRSVALIIVHDLASDPPLIFSFIRTGDPANEPELLFKYGGSLPYERLYERLNNLERTNKLAQIVLMTPSGNVVADSTAKNPAGTSPGDQYVYLDIDRQVIARALHERDGVATKLYYIDKEPFLRFYLPFIIEGNVIGLLQVTVSPEYMGEMESVSHQVRNQWLVSSILLLLLGISLYRLFKYLVQLEKSAMQGARVEAMGALAGGVAHELRNPLSIIRALSEEITTENPPESRASRNAADIVAETARLNDLVTHFLSLSRSPGAGDTKPVELRDEIERVVQLMRKGEGHHVTFVVSLPPEPVFVLADEHALRQLFLNLLINAREAVDAVSKPEVQVALKERRGVAEIHIIDNGHGIPPQDLARIFDPFFTTKSMGTGLGLAICRGIAENLEGTISVVSTPGKGTEVTVQLPQAATPEPSAE